MSYKYRSEFDVEPISPGTPFPLDMLRYDRCSPSEGTDVSTIRESIERAARIEENPPVRICLVRVHEGKDVGHTPRRWESFGWRVVRTDTRKLP